MNKMQKIFKHNNKEYLYTRTNTGYSEIKKYARRDSILENDKNNIGLFVFVTLHNQNKWVGGKYQLNTILEHNDNFVDESGEFVWIFNKCIKKGDK
jgi:hypothetical protein